ncbi:hypothetical protein FBZ94_10148 [Bradyrhizobium sacchari]|uniref:Uncharacterized protein n=1 Tax=Bradyrhizobium sacchari TaxID=1399419 RepID=A0A560J5R7_9BRAD|nr:hypothetical protein [Bradyrhizobium sacchari]TWB66377.1 hypothetical protein FBZ94_10148 [Bradyrhizobium sacchari]TWB83614.1 hypothetical protein FBZ95_10148 [Bradyrhizobium sacchari]
MPLGPDCFHWASRWRAIAPRGDEDEIVARCAPSRFLGDAFVLSDALVLSVVALSDVLDLGDILVLGDAFFNEVLAARAFFASLT